MAKNKDIVLTEDAIVKRIDEVAKRMVAEGNRSVAKSTSSRNNSSNITFGSVDPHVKARVAEKVSNKVILESNPTMTRAIEILTGFIVCPNGGSVVTLNYEATIPSDDKLNKEASVVASIIDDYFTNTIKLQNEVSDMVYKTLALDGSHVTAFIPDSQINSLYDSTALESGIKELIPKLNPEGSGGKTKLVSVVNDPSVMLLAENKRYLQMSRVGNESSEKAGINAARVLRKRRIFRDVPSVKLERGTGLNEITAAIKKTIPSEACKPIIFKGEPDNPYYYIIALDEDGYPIEVNEEIDYDKDLASLDGKQTDKEQLQKLSMNIKGSGSKVNTLPELQEEFNRYLEADIIPSLIEGDYAEKYTLKDDEMIKTIMFHRFLKNQRTRLLMLPAHLVSYFCFETDKYGVGESLISRTKALSKIYTVMFYANFLGSLANATPQKEVVIDFDSEDIDQNKTFEMVVNELIMARLNNFDFNFNGPSDVIRNIMKSGVEFKLNNLETGDLPNMNIEVNDKKRDRQPVNSEFLELLTKLITMRFGFSHELVDNSYSPQFSSQVNQNNDITARQMTKYTTMASDKLTDRVIKETLNTPSLITKLTDAMSGKDEREKYERLEYILANLTVSLPAPDNASINEKHEAIEDNLKVIRTIVDAIIPDSIFEGVENVSRDYMEQVRETITGFFMTDYIRKNSSFKHIIDKIRTSEGIKSIINGEGEFKEILMEVFAEHAISVMKTDGELDAELTKAEEELAAKLDGEDEDAIDYDDTPEEEELADIDSGEDDDVDLPEDDNIDNTDDTVTDDTDEGVVETDNTADDEGGDDLDIPTIDV